MLRKHFSLLVLTMVGLGISNSSFAQVTGCTNPIACNYSPNAIKEDQTCEFPGCTDPTALNYLVYAGCDDGSCVFSTGTTCMGDLNDDGTVNVVDLTNFLAVFGSVCSD